MNNNTLDKLSKWIIVLSVFFLFIALISPFILTKNLFIKFSTTGEIGDTIGGIMSPFIGIASTFVMFLAFYMQYKANKMMQLQFEKNQFENQFFEMLKTHKENSYSISYSHFESEDYKGFGDEIAYRNWKENRIKGFDFIVYKINQRYNNLKVENPLKDNIDNFRTSYKENWNDSYGHYFRHLFLIVKFVVNKPDSFLTYEDKRSYLRILRASLSTNEQIFLYYNWLAKYGTQWENEHNHFFTDYRMIHNINNDIHDDFAIKKTTPFQELLNNKKYLCEKNRKDDFLFELIS